MKKISRNIFYQGRNLFGDKTLIFWSIIYPLIMAIFFYTAFSGIMNMELESIAIGISKDNPIRYILEEIEIVDVYSMKDVEAKEKLEDEEIVGFIDGDLNLLVKKSGINQSIIKEILDQIKQMEKLNVAMDRFDYSANYIQNKNQRADTIIIIFYSLIAMVSTYGIFSGIETVSLMQANLSNVGKRLNATPLKKKDFLLAGIAVALFINMLSNAILLIFIKYVLKLNLFTEMLYSGIFIILGNLFGVGLGILIGASSKKSANAKTILGILITLVLSFLSGMMSTDIKIMLDKKVPLLGKVNPISIITNNLYKINLLANTKNAMGGITILGIYCLILIFLSYGFLRGKTYDSI
ncbi:MAG: ABC transporter permease [Tissierellaceae bacterium]|nr:ABC transporter permease [Tissierellaceae bacterium]